MPELVIYNSAGKPETVAYQMLASLLLNELQSEHKGLEEARAQLRSQSEELVALRSQAADLQAMKAQLAELRRVTTQLAAAQVSGVAPARQVASLK